MLQLKNILAVSSLVFLLFACSLNQQTEIEKITAEKKALVPHDAQTTQEIDLADEVIVTEYIPVDDFSWKTYTYDQDYFFQFSYPDYFQLAEEEAQSLEFILAKKFAGRADLEDEVMSITMFDGSLEEAEYSDTAGGIYLRYNRKYDKWISSPIPNEQKECLEKNIEKVSFSFIGTALAAAFSCEKFIEEQTIKPYTTTKGLKAFTAISGDVATTYKKAYIEHPDGEFYLLVMLTSHLGGYYEEPISTQATMLSILDSVEFR